MCPYILVKIVNYKGWNTDFLFFNRKELFITCDIENWSPSVVKAILAQHPRNTECNHVSQCRSYKRIYSIQQHVTCISLYKVIFRLLVVHTLVEKLFSLGLATIMTRLISKEHRSSLFLIPVLNKQLNKI